MISVLCVFLIQFFQMAGTKYISTEEDKKQRVKEFLLGGKDADAGQFVLGSRPMCVT